jgi:hypothetical protein
MLAHSQPEAAKRLLVDAQADVMAKWKVYEHLASQGAAPQPAGEAKSGD